jgi:hypothetical protein
MTQFGGLAGAERPSKSWVAAFVKAAALNTLAARGNAPINVQQRYYAAYTKKLTDGQAKWPGINFTAGLDSEIEKYLSTNRLMRGAGQDW